MGTCFSLAWELVWLHVVFCLFSFSSSNTSAVVVLHPELNRYPQYTRLHSNCCPMLLITCLMLTRRGKSRTGLQFSWAVGLQMRLRHSLKELVAFSEVECYPGDKYLAKRRANPDACVTGSAGYTFSHDHSHANIAVAENPLITLQELRCIILTRKVTRTVEAADYTLKLHLCG